MFDMLFGIRFAVVSLVVLLSSSEPMHAFQHLDIHTLFTLPFVAQNCLVTVHFKSLYPLSEVHPLFFVFT